MSKLWKWFMASPQVKAVALAILATVVVFAMNGCVTSYHHISDPTTFDDAGVDLICGGVELGNKLTISGSMCKNISMFGGEFAIVSVEYHWNAE